MKNQLPRFELTRVFADGSQEAPQIVPVTEIPLTTQMSRRGFIAAGLTASALLGLLGRKPSALAGRYYVTPENQDEFSPGGQILRAHHGKVILITTLPNNGSDQIFTLSSKGTLKVWEMPEGKFLPTSDQWKWENLWVEPIALSQNGKFIASVLRNVGPSRRNFVRAWGFPSGVPSTAPLGGEMESYHSLALSQEGDLLAGATFGEVKVWSLPSERITANFRGFSSRQTTLVFFKDNQSLCAGLDNGTIQVFSLSDNQLPFTLMGHKGAISALTIHNDWEILISGSDDSTMKLWDWKNQKLLKTIEAHEKRIGALTFLPNEKILVSGSDDHSIKFWTFPDGQLVATLKGHASPIQCLAATQNNEFLISGDERGVVIIWDLKKQAIHSFLFDPGVNEKDAVALSYSVFDPVTSTTVTYTLPCGSPIPQGATCICNCVPGEMSTPQVQPAPPPRERNRSYGGTGTAPCGTPIPPGAICTCNCVCTCQAV